MGAGRGRGDLYELNDLDGTLLVEVEMAGLGVLVHVGRGGRGVGREWLLGEHGGESGTGVVHLGLEGAVGAAAA